MKSLQLGTNWISKLASYFEIYLMVGIWKKNAAAKNWAGVLEKRAAKEDHRWRTSGDRNTVTFS